MPSGNTTNRAMPKGRNMPNLQHIADLIESEDYLDQYLEESIDRMIDAEAYRLSIA